MRIYLLLICVMSYLGVLGQTRDSSIYSKELVYQVNPRDTTQKILVHIYTQDSCGSETSHCSFDYVMHLPFESQMDKPLPVREIGFREYSYGGNCKPVIVRILDKDNKLLQRFIYKYNKEEKIEELLILDFNDKQQSRSRYQYGRASELLKQVRLDNKDSAEHITTYSYKDGMLSMETRFHLSLKDTAVCQYTYNNRRQLIVEEWSGLDGSDKEFAVTIYSNSLKIKELSFTQDGEAIEFRTTYYKNGLEKTSQKVDLVTGEILDYEFHEYQFK